MMKFFFWLLLLANGLLFAFHQGYLEQLFPSGREPSRIARQLNADKFKLLEPPVTNVSSAASAPGEAGTPTPAMADAGQEKNQLACTEIGNFTVAEARQFEARLAAAQLSGKLSRRDVRENSSHMILIPPQGGKEGADKRIGDLRNLGITDFYVIQDNSEQRWGISLGIFKTEEAARARMAALNQQGVRSARLIDHKVPLNRVAFQVRDLDGDAQSAIANVKSEFPRQEMRGCE